MFKRTEHLVQQSVECKLKQMLKPFNPLTPMSDQDWISPYNINTILTR